MSSKQAANNVSLFMDRSGRWHCNPVEQTLLAYCGLAAPGLHQTQERVLMALIGASAQAALSVVASAL